MVLGRNSIKSLVVDTKMESSRLLSQWDGSCGGGGARTDTSFLKLVNRYCRSTVHAASQ